VGLSLLVNNADRTLQEAFTTLVSKSVRLDSVNAPPSLDTRSASLVPMVLSVDAIFAA
jgi:hypothetical protein